MTAAAAKSSEQFVALGGLRGVAALVVVQWHGYRFLGGAPLPAGFLAVDFFFLLSGWVLAHAYDRRLDTTMSTGQFIRARLLRLYPVYLLGLFLTFTGAVVTGQFPIVGLLAGLVFLPDLGFDWLLPASWSLTAELLANLPFALFHRRLSQKLLLVVIATAFIALIVCASSYGTLDIGNRAATWPGMFARVFFSFPLGVLLYRKRETLAKWAPRWSSWPAMGLLVAALGLPAPAQWGGLRDIAIIALLLPAILLFASNARPGKATAWIATAMGDMSYPLYLLHIAAFGATDIVLTIYAGHDLDSAPLSLALPLLAGIVVVSLLVDRFFDRPIRRRVALQFQPVTRPS